MTHDLEDDPQDWHYAPSGTLHGALQRGHGIAVIKLRRDREQAGLVYACTSRDTRWDWQVDDRYTYLARLLRDLHLDPAPLITQLHACGPRLSWPHRDPADDHNQFNLAVGILEALARTGNEQAREALREYVHDGARWIDVLQTLTHEWPVEWWDDLWETAAARIHPDDTMRLFPNSQPWQRWHGRDPRLDAVLNAARSARPPGPDHRTILAEASDAELIALLRTPGTDRDTIAFALRQIRRRSYPMPELLDVVEQLAPTRPPGLRSTLFSLGPLIAPPARTWATDPDHPLFPDAAYLLAKHGDEQDIPLLLTAVDELTHSGQWCGYDQLAEGLARILAPLPPTTHTDSRTRLIRRLRSLAFASPHTYERASHLRSLLLLDPDNTRNALPIFLLDCEPDVRHLAAQHTSLITDDAHQWLTELRDDPIENNDIKHTATQRITLA
ncbi:hypothetical protein [Pseudofrankia sp. BMG5.36]|uniref:hypothetical protein n=1 Tax=Pseudofrankia sp. BMG5.36 TaxID=1834512 RepID=UPI0008DB22F6|nr:hypothetical protein [Pseudofrankia sp. BMG5.36]OHV57970.1 hypothetical protein BCD48_42785 [Pseudofrankia sp. BMG5.36]